ncbi:Arc family DNA-binding protein [Mesorhizobium sp. M3A.F.Ca.ET.174.01.1.1]|nr:Arc family DNA-binding protein [Mesorhizobium sp. M3A.F.Ca.ET.175.01.1.1]TGT22700.1 Arc family DNA-binding protein [Mesorhizobium sp. M3A.F.Ca.ET.174.01.1.1]
MRGKTVNVSKQPKTIFRTPPDLKQWLVARAERNGRSMTSELIQILKAAQQADRRGTKASRYA